MTAYEVCITDTFPREIEDWDACTTFHTRAWFDVGTGCFNTRSAHLVVRANKAVVAYLPVVPRRFGHNVIAGPVQSGHAPQLIFADGIDSDKAAICRRVAARAPGTRVLGTHEASSVTAFSLALSGTFEDYWQTRVSSKAKYDVRKSERATLVTRITDESGLAAFYPLYVRRMHELGSPAMGLGVFQAMSARLGEAMRFAVTTLDSTVVAASVVLLHRSRWMAHPWSVSHADFRHLSVNYGHYRDLVRFGFENGYRQFSMGPSLADSPWCRIKIRFGAVPSPVVRLDGKPFSHASQRLPVRIAGYLIKRSPRPLYDAAAPWVAALASRLPG